jgi:hypothetical protein
LFKQTQKVDVSYTVSLLLIVLFQFERDRASPIRAELCSPYSSGTVFALFERNRVRPIRAELCSP